MVGPAVRAAVGAHIRVIPTPHPRRRVHAPGTALLYAIYRPTTESASARACGRGATRSERARESERERETERERARDRERASVRARRRDLRAVRRSKRSVARPVLPIPCPSTVRRRRARESVILSFLFFGFFAAVTLRTRSCAAIYGSVSRHDESCNYRLATQTRGSCARFPDYVVFWIFFFFFIVFYTELFFNFSNFFFFFNKTVFKSS